MELKTAMVVSLDRMENGAHRATFKVDDNPEQTVVAITKMQALDKAFSEIRKIIQNKKT